MLPGPSGPPGGLRASDTQVRATLPTELPNHDPEALAELGPSLAEAAAAPPQLPDTAEGRRLAAALQAYTAAGTLGQPGAAAVQPTADSGQVPDVDEEDDGDGLLPGDEEDEPEGAVFPALRILKEAVARSKMQPIPVIRSEEGDSGPWPLISEDMDGEPRWGHPDVTLTRVPHIKANGKCVRRDQLDVPAFFGEGVLGLIDRNGSYPSACSGVPLAPNKPRTPRWPLKRCTPGSGAPAVCSALRPAREGSSAQHDDARVMHSQRPLSIHKSLSGRSRSIFSVCEFCSCPALGVFAG